MYLRITNAHAHSTGAGEPTTGAGPYPATGLPRTGETDQNGTIFMVKFQDVHYPNPEITGREVGG